LINQLEQETTEPIKRIKQLIPDLSSKIAGKNQGEIIDALNLILTKRDFYQEDVFKAIAQVLLEKKPNLIDCNERRISPLQSSAFRSFFPSANFKSSTTLHPETYCQFPLLATNRTGYLDGGGRGKTHHYAMDKMED
jgi:hypothetical protein